MSSFHGNFFVRSTDLLAMPSVPQDLSYAIEIQIEDNITAPFVVLQTAVLHTTCYGEQDLASDSCSSVDSWIVYQASAASVLLLLRCPPRATSRTCSPPLIKSRSPRSSRTRPLSAP